MKAKRKKTKIPSMRARLFGALLVVGTVSAAIMLLAMTAIYFYFAYSAKRSEVYGFAGKLVEIYVEKADIQDSDIRVLPDGMITRIVVSDEKGNIKVNISNSEALQENVPEGELISEAVSGVFADRFSIKDRYGVLAYPFYLFSRENCIGTIEIVYSISDIVDVAENILVYGLVCVFFVFIILVFVANGYSKKVVRPLKLIADAMQEIIETYPGKKLNVRSSIEMKKISDSFNHAVRDMQAIEKTRQEFVSNVSHELKTPLASMKVLADSLLSQPNAPIKVYQEFLGDINNEIERENKIITDLLSLVKLDRDAGDMKIESVDVGKMLGDIVRRISPIADRRSIDIRFESYKNVIADIDEIKMTSVFTNLIENAVKYNVDGGFVHVSLNSDGKMFEVKVADSGVGIPADSLEHIFDRFYRVDKARSRDTGGTGLGLSIAKSTVIMHNGTICVTSELGSGTTFTVRVPITYSKAEKDVGI